MSEDNAPDVARTYAFNRRIVADQTAYVRASCEREAWRKVRDGDVFEASDQAIVRTTIRREPTHDEDI